MRCDNCGAPLKVLANGGSECSYCGNSEAPQTKASSVGALVDQILGQVQPGLASSLPTANRTVNFVSQTSLNINGKSYKNLDEVPAELRQAINQGLAMTNQLGMFARSVE